jgi:Ca-activated chloride channel family protein
METRNRLKLAGALLVATAVAGVFARGKVSGATPGARFTAPGKGPVSFTSQLDRTAVLLGRDDQVRMELVIGAKEDATHPSRRVPTDVVVILDRSGSMGGEKIEHARAAVRELIAQLGSEDRFALVTYSNDAALTLPLARVSDRGRDGWLATVSEIGADGGTNMSAGLDLALDTIEHARVSGRAPRAILISDGLANQGDPSHEGLVRRASRAPRGEYVLSAVGVGSDFNEVLMTALADAGTGNYYYLQGSQDLAIVFGREFDTARSTVASNVTVRIEPGDGVRVVDAAGYPLEHDGGTVLFRPGTLFAGQERRIWVTMGVPNQAVGEHALGRFAVAYNDGSMQQTLALGDIPRVTCVAGENDYFARVDEKSWTRAVLVDGYNRMQEKVAREVKEGRRDAALGMVRSFREETAAANARVNSAPVAAQLGSMDKLEAEVSAAFEGKDQAARQNLFGKQRGAEALDARRAGSKK